MSSKEKNKSNFIRSSKIANFKRKNNKLVKEMKEYLDSQNEIKDIALFNNLFLKLQYCSNLSLYKENIKGEVTYIASHTCDSKLCNICNYNRKRGLRRKYLTWFNENEQLIQYDDKYLTKTQAQIKNITGKEIDYDVMHLTLTVPHTEDGFNGNRYYFRDIISKFNALRRNDEFKDYVLAGEYGVETTRNKNGLHIHIHSLLLVKRSKQNRNHLHRIILYKWNKQTINTDIKRNYLDNETKANILKSNKLINDDFIKQLNPMGATIIGLETIYSYYNGIKNRNIGFGTKNFINAILETIKYHFEPAFLNKKDGHFDIDLICEVLPEIYRQPLYRKFGAWHGEKSLNIKSDNLLTEFKEVQDMLINEDTGEIAEQNKYYVINPIYISHYNEKIEINQLSIKYAKQIEAMSTQSALNTLNKSIITEVMRVKNKNTKQLKPNIFIN